MKPTVRPPRPSRIAFLLALAGSLVAVTLPAPWLAEARRAFPWFSRAISRVERLWPAVDMVHVVIFAVLGVLAALAFAHMRLTRLLAGLVVFAAASELVQFAIPGRTPRFEEFLLDVGVAAAVVLLVRGMQQLSGRSTVGSMQGDHRGGES